LRAIRVAQPAAQVIMLSGRQTPATIVEADRLGAADYVLKPGDPDGVGEAALESAIRNALERQSLTAEVARLGAQIAEDPEGAQPCWSSGPSMEPVLAMVDRVADSDVTVLLRGESGVGKEVIARELHRRSRRRTKPFVKVNCAALPTELLESELFGHERGAFTGAGATRIGKFEFAQNGTILWMRSAKCLRRFRRSCCTCFRTGSSPASAAIARSKWTCASSRRRTSIWKP
jgi:DNA-binding NtrC family response regulator